jgi:hypothetical protein
METMTRARTRKRRRRRHRLWHDSGAAKQSGSCRHTRWAKYNLVRASMKSRAHERRGAIIISLHLLEGLELLKLLELLELLKLLKLL